MYKEVTSFLGSRAIAITGFSRSPRSFSRTIYSGLLARGFKVYPVNHCQEEIDGITVYRSIGDVPGDVEAVYILNRANVAIRIAREAAEQGIRKIWIHVKCNTMEAREVESKYGISMIMGECFFMWAEPVQGLHGLHRVLRRLIGKKRRND